MQGFARYSLVERIGAGGMAEIWKAKATGPEGFEKVLAIKRILPHLTANDDFVAMFIGEAKLAAQLIHPNIIQVFDFGKTNEGDYFIAMEYVAGPDLGHLVRRLKKMQEFVPPRVAFFVALEAARGLAHAHDACAEDGASLGIVHRDVSPANILVSESGEVKITDFGIAKAVDSRSLTNEGQVRGKMQYMSPEQARAEPVTVRSDVFSLGVVLYWMLAGRRLFPGSSLKEVYGEIMSYTGLEFHDLASIAPEAQALLRRCLAPKPEDRFGSAHEMAAELNAVLGPHGGLEAREALGRLVARCEARESHIPGDELIITKVLQAGDPTEQTLSRAESSPSMAPAASLLPKRRVAWWAAVIGTIALVSSAAVILASQFWPDGQTPSVSREAFEVYFEGQTEIANNAFPVAQQSFEKAIELDPDFALAHFWLAYVLNWRGTGDPDVPLERAFEIAKANPSSVPERDFALMRALRAERADDYDETIRILTEIDKKDPGDRLVVFWVGDMHYHQGNPEAIAYLERSVADHPTFEAAQDHLLRAYIHAGRADDIVRQAENYLARVRSRQAFWKAGEAFTIAERWDRAIEMHRAALEIFPGDSQAYSGLVLIGLLKNDRASVTETLEAWRADPAGEPALQLQAAAWAFGWFGNHAKAEQEHRTRMRVVSEMDRPIRPRYLRAYSEFGVYLARRGRHKEAHTWFEAAGSGDRLVRAHRLYGALERNDREAATQWSTRGPAFARLPDLVEAHFGCTAPVDPALLSSFAEVAARVDFHYRGVFNLTLARCYRAAGTPQLAVDPLEQVGAYPVLDEGFFALYAESLAELADVHTELGNEAEALKAWRRLAAIRAQADEGDELAARARRALSSGL